MCKHPFTNSVSKELAYLDKNFTYKTDMCAGASVFWVNGAITFRCFV